MVTVSWKTGPVCHSTNPGISGIGIIVVVKSYEQADAIFPAHQRGMPRLLPDWVVGG